MSDDARPLIDNPYRASHTPIYAGGVNVTDLMARAWDRGFAAGDERLRSDYFDKRLDESWEPSPAALPDERLREALREIVDTAPGIDRWTIDRRLDDEQWTGKVAVEVVRASSVDVMVAALRAALAAADREKPEEPKGPCGLVMVGEGTDTYDPICELPAAHLGPCKSSAAITQNRIAPPVSDEPKEKP